MSRPVRVAGTDPGTSSLDVLVLEDGRVVAQHRFPPSALQADPSLPVRWLTERGPFDLVAGPSGYGLPLVPRANCGPRDIERMILVRPDERGPAAPAEPRRGVRGFAALLRELCASSLPVVFLPGVVHLSTVPAHRKINRIDLGTPDKLCVAALALALRGQEGNHAAYRAVVVELGSAFTACLALDGGRVVDGLGGTSGPTGWGSSGAWDGEVAYLLSPLQKRDLFAGGAGMLPAAEGHTLFRESLLRAVAGLCAVTPVEEIILAGRLLEMEPALADAVAGDLTRFGTVARLGTLPGAWVKHAAQGAALLADGLAGGRWASLVEHLRLKEAAGTVLDGLRQPRTDEVRAWFGA